jgi:Tfp pilus assembly protein PilO
MSISRPIFIIIACIILALVFGGGLLWPKYQELKNVDSEIDFKTQEFDSKEVYFSSLSQISEELKKHNEDISKIDSALPEDPSVPSFLNFLQGACSQSGIILSAIGPASVSSSGEGVKEISLVLQVQGSYLSFKKFLSVLEKSSRIVESENISFSSPRDNDGPFMFKLTVKTHSY